MIDYDSELAQYHQRLMRALQVRSDDRVIDIGCGMGQTTRDVARLVTDGSVIGCDIADSALRRARELTGDGAPNTHFVRADASRAPFRSETFDVAISRFGTMFFENPVVAFTNIHRTLRPSGRLTMMVWQSPEQNEWAMEIEQAVTEHRQAPPSDAPGASAFSLGDSHLTDHILRSAGFADVTFEAVRATVNYGSDVESAFTYISAFARVTSALESQTHLEREETRARLREVVSVHFTHKGVLFDSAAWIVSARKLP